MRGFSTSTTIFLKKMNIFIVSMDTRKNVRAIVYRKIDQEYQFLLLFAARKQYWQNPQGGLEDDEDLSAAAKRETHEETDLPKSNLEVMCQAAHSTSYNAVRLGRDIHVDLTAVAVRYTGPDLEIHLSEDEGHTDSKWCSYDEARSLLTLYPEQREAFEEVCKKLFDL